MADTKTTALTENTTPAATDIMYIVDDPGGSPLSQKITLANIKALVNDITTDAEWDAKGDLIVGSGANTADRLAVGTDGYVLTADAVSALGVKWAAAGAGTGVAADTIWDAAGDLVQGTGANTAARLAIGTANQLLRVNSGATAVEWAGVGRVLISEQTPTSTGTVTWDSIPATYESLEIEYVARCTKNATLAYFVVRFNNDTTDGNYRFTQIGSASASGDSSRLGEVTAATGPANTAGAGRIKIFDYASTVFTKDAQNIMHMRYGASSQANYHFSVNWESTNAITRVDLVTESGNWDTGSTFRLYGVY